MTDKKRDTSVLMDDGNIEAMISEASKDHARARRRKLRKNEFIDLTSRGIPRVCLGGNIDVFQYPDGHIEPVIPKLGKLMDFAFINLVLDDAQPLRPNEVRFIRKYMVATQEQYASVLGVSRETLNRIEMGRMAVSVAVGAQIRNHGLMFLVEEKKKRLKQPQMTKARNKPQPLQKLFLITELGRELERFINAIGDGVKLELSPC